MENKLKVGITHGDVNGISYELIIKLLAENKICEVCTPIFYGSPKVAAYYRKSLNIENFILNSIQHPGEANSKRSNVINCISDNVKVDSGKETEEANEVAMQVLKKACEDLDNEHIDLLVAAPQGYKSFQLENSVSYFHFLQNWYRNEDIIKLYVGDKLKIGFVTDQLAFKDIYSHITTKNILSKLQRLDECLKMDFTIRKPRIAVLGLNPFNKKNCELPVGEEKDVIYPAIEQARDIGIMAFGPYAADDLFCGTDYEKFDAVLALYHEQGAMPFKIIEGFGGAALISGLPFVYTTTVNGAAYDISGKGKADESGLRNAVYLAIDVYHNRRMNEEISAHPLPHYDIATNSNETDLNVEQIAGVEKETIDEI
ncbi:MAG: 4-hydroxythreonine-4-phosphate dehydrogenase PdxA [Odoribacter sp.]|nr:4-hydroxythreonine-4-phosphate dehydrogenase PdxA [Odoribacter sp.]